MTDNPTMQDYLDGGTDSDREPEPVPEAEPDPADVDMTPRCAHCGREFEKRGYWLNLHSANCEGRSLNSAN